MNYDELKENPSPIPDSRMAQLKVPWVITTFDSLFLMIYDLKNLKTQNDCLINGATFILNDQLLILGVVHILRNHF